jgi:hypothetical protein
MHEERAIYAGLVLVGGPVFAIAIASGQPIGAMHTVAGLIALAGAIGFLRSRREDEIPRAKTRRFKGD